MMIIMLIAPWDKLPQQMKNDEVKPYYDLLSKRKMSLIFKRVFDFLVSLIMLVILLPFFLILAILIKIDSKGPVFYRQERITKDGKTFKIYKFRTMCNGADQKGSLVTVQNDSRITAVGAKIRKCRLDEIPQLINVLKGEMSFVGTRPEVQRYVDSYSDEMLATLLLPAGITSLASVEFKDEDLLINKFKTQGKSVDDIYVNEVLPLKMEYNLDALRHFSFWNDIKTMIKTFIAVIK